MRKSLCSAEPEGSLLCLHEPATCPCPEPNSCSPCLSIIFEIHFSCISIPLMALQKLESFFNSRPKKTSILRIFTWYCVRNLGLTVHHLIQYHHSSYQSQLITSYAGWDIIQSSLWFMYYWMNEWNWVHYGIQLGVPRSKNVDQCSAVCCAFSIGTSLKNYNSLIATEW